MHHKGKIGAALCVAGLLMSGCTQETQNKVSRAFNNWTGTNGVLEVYAGDKLARRFIKIDKLTTATGTDDGANRPYRYGYGYLDANLNGLADKDESYVYFEISNYSTPNIFYEAPKIMPPWPPSE